MQLNENRDNAAHNEGGTRNAERLPRSDARISRRVTENGVETDVATWPVKLADRERAERFARRKVEEMGGRAWVRMVRDGTWRIMLTLDLSAERPGLGWYAVDLSSAAFDADHKANVATRRYAETRSCRDKHVYHSEKAALRAGSRWGRMNGQMYVYRCPWCGNWHLTRKKTKRAIPCPPYEARSTKPAVGKVMRSSQNSGDSR